MVIKKVILFISFTGIVFDSEVIELFLSFGWNFMFLVDWFKFFWINNWCSIVKLVNVFFYCS